VCGWGVGLAVDSPLDPSEEDVLRTGRMLVPRQATAYLGLDR